MSHYNLHRRHARAAIPDPHAIADAFANAIANADPWAKASPKASPTPEASPQQVVTVYTTASATFDGPTAGMTTILSSSSTPAASPSPTAGASTPVTSASQSDTSSADAAQSSIVADTSAPSSSGVSSSVAVNTDQASQSSPLPASIVPTTTVPTSVAIAAATGSVTSISSQKTSSTVTAASSTATAVSSSSGGMSTGGKAGLAIGIILLIGAAVAMAVFFVKKRKATANHDRLEDEKNDVLEARRQASIRSNRTAPNAPQLSLRPITQFTPTLNEKPDTSLTPASPWERQMGGQEQNKANPFGNHAEAIDATNANGPSIVKDVGPGGEIVADALVAGAATGLARGASIREDGHKPLDFTTGGTFMGPPSPVGTEFSTSSDVGAPTQTNTGAAIAAAGGPPNSTVHRVQLDFKPSMGDEIELRAGQLIRMLHEYDDGWALCIRLDRSQQGVVPRTCLSTRPVKPRPQQNGPRGPPGMRIPQPRPMSPANQSPRPMAPNGPPANRPMTPNGTGRPMTPTNPQYNPRPMTPNGDSRPRSPSVAQNQGPRASPGPSRMKPAPQANTNSPQGQTFPPSQGFPPAAPVGRKPVPGQAL
ncbi:hypothetical protein B7494_g621 [Chlorociboria aeruginascens]|nr:hypothetical protein B7494_g621 [Chlorociboria aeruginascens]